MKRTRLDILLTVSIAYIDDMDKLNMLLRYINGNARISERT